MIYPGAVLKRGSKGDAVKTIQRALGLTADGIFGALTEAAVTRFQRAHGLTVDGVVGEKTWAKLFAPIPVATDLPRSAIAVAYTQRNVAESPLGSNRGKMVDQYLASVGLAPGNPWCMAFVYWCAREAANQVRLDNPLLQTGSCSAQYRWARDNGLLVPKPEYGDVFLCIGGETGHYHTGFVASEVANGRFATIEGNSNDQGSANGVKVAFRSRGRRLETCHYIRL